MTASIIDSIDVQKLAEDDRGYGDRDQRCPVALQAKGAGSGDAGGVIQERQLPRQK